MSVSIAKLAIMLTADTSGMQRGFAQARSQVTGFQSSLAGLGRGFALIGGATAAIGASKWILGIANDSEQAVIRLERLTGSMEKAREMTKMVQAFGDGLFEDKEILNATTKLMAFGKTANEIPGILQNLGDLAISTDQSLEMLATRFVKSAASAEKLTAAGQRAAGSMQNMTDSVSGQWKKLWDNMEDAARPAAEGIGNTIEEILRSVNTLFLNREQRFDLLFGDDKGGTRTIKAVAEIKGLLDDGTKSAKAIADELARFTERGEQLRESLRTPGEIFADSMREIDELFLGGAIGLETYRRAAEEAGRTFMNAGSAGKSAVESIRRAPATTFGTSAGFSAIHSGRAELARLAEVERQNLAEQKQHTEILKTISTKVGKPPVLTFPVANF